MWFEFFLCFGLIIELSLGRELQRAALCRVPEDEAFVVRKLSLMQ